MKKIFFALVLTMMLTSTASAYETNCGTDHAVYGEDRKTIISCIPENKWNEAMKQPLIQEENLPTVHQGGVIIDQAGIVSTCKSIYDTHGCVDITRTEYYINSMKETARQLVSKGMAHLFPMMNYWIMLSR